MPATRAMFQPLMATTCVSPVVVKSLGHGAAHPLPKADEDAGRETGLGLGEGARERAVDAPAQPLDDGLGTEPEATSSSARAFNVPAAPRAREEAGEARRVRGAVAPHVPRRARGRRG